jgi:hypothetical protein
MTDEERERVLREARQHIADARELEREHADWLARHDPLQEDMLRLRRKSLEPKPMSEAPIIRKVHINETAPAPVAATGPSAAELVAVLGECFAIEREKIRKELRAEQAANSAALENQIAELRGQVGVLLNLMSGSKADVVPLPRRLSGAP